MRAALLGLAVTVLPACHEHKIWVNNAGTGVALVHVRWYTSHEEPITGYTWWEREHDNWTVGPGQSGEQNYPNPYLELIITEEASGAVLFQSRLNDGDFRDEHGRLELTVYP